MSKIFFERITGLKGEDQTEPMTETEQRLIEDKILRTQTRGKCSTRFKSLLSKDAKRWLRKQGFKVQNDYDYIHNTTVKIYYTEVTWPQNSVKYIVCDTNLYSDRHCKSFYHPDKVPLDWGHCDTCGEPKLCPDCVKNGAVCCDGCKFNQTFH